MTAKSVHTPIVSSSFLSKDMGTPVDDPSEYQSIIRALQYVVLTRPNITYAVNRICQFIHVHTEVYCVALKQIFKYLCSTVNYEVCNKPSERLSLVGYADANYGLDFNDRRSTTGYCVYFESSPVSWCSKKQSVVSHSTIEAKYRGLAAATADVTWLMSLLGEL